MTAEANTGARGSIELIDVTKRYGSVVAVDSINLTVKPGEFLSLLGPSGCGKTTTLRMLAGFEQPDGGHILVNGRPSFLASASRRWAAAFIGNRSTSLSRLRSERLRMQDSTARKSMVLLPIRAT